MSEALEVRAHPGLHEAVLVRFAREARLRSRDPVPSVDDVRALPTLMRGLLPG